MFRQRRKLSALLSTLATIVPLLCLSAVAHASTVPPGNHEYYTMALGRLATSKTDTGNWVRLAYYNFRTDGIVDEGFWYYGDDPSSARTTLPNHVCVANCEQYAPLGFGNNGVSKTLSGTYTVSGTTVSITWTSTGSPSESWTISDRTGMTELSLRSSSYGASIGHGFGSNQSSTYAGAPISDVANYISSTGQNLALSGFQRQWSDDPDASWTNFSEVSAYTFSAGTITNCSSTCIFMAPPATTGDPDPSRYDYQNPSTSLPRNLATEDWKLSLANGTGCYDDNLVNPAHAHTWAGETVVDDSGNWRGFVRVEYSMNGSNPNYMSVGWFTTDTLGI